MHCSKLSAVLLGLTTFAAGSPLYATSDLAVRESVAVEKGLIWRGRRDGRDGRDGRDDKGRNDRNRNRNQNNIIIAQPINVQLNQIQIIQEVKIINIIQQNIIVINNGRDEFRDKVRKNHFRNRNRNRNVNTVIIVVVVIADNRDSNNRRTRYLTRQLESNPEIKEQEWIVLTEAQTMTVDSGSAATGTGEGVASATGVGEAVPRVASFDSAAAPVLSNDSLLLPEGNPAPKWEAFASQGRDPASILDDDSDSFVSFVDQSGNGDGRD